MSTFTSPTVAFDFGTKRVGVAVSRATLAEPLKVVNNDDSLWNEISQLIAQEKPSQLVVGISEAEMAVKSEEFAQELEKRFGLPVNRADETLTSYAVTQKIRFMPKMKRAGAIDHFAAAEILQAWLDEQ